MNKKYEIGDIVRIEEPNTFLRYYWNRSFKIVNMSDEELTVEIIGEPIRIKRRGPFQNSFGDKIIRRFSIPKYGHVDIILVKREDELMGKYIKKHKI